MNVVKAGARHLKSLLTGSRSSTFSTELTRDDVIWAFRIILEREPESEEAVTGRVANYSTIKQLRSELLSTPEYRLKNPDAIPFANQRNIVIKELDGGLRLFVDLSDVVIGLNIVRGSYERHELQFIKDTVKSGQTAIDLGANIGFFTVHLASLVDATGKVYAFEPLPRNAELVERSLAENAFDDRVVLKRAAVGAAPGKINLFYEIQSMNSGGSFLVEDMPELPDGHDLLPVDVVSLDQLPMRRPIDFIKMDIEGAEPLAMRGAEEILARDRPIIMAELNPDIYSVVSKCTPTEFVSEMAGRGYDCYLLQGGRVGQKVTQVDKLCTAIFKAVQGR